MDIWPIVFLAANYVCSTVPVFILAGKLGVPHRGWALVPVGHIAVLARAGGGSGWYALMIFIPLFNFVVYGWLWAKVSEETDQPQALGWLCAVPVLNWVLQWVIALESRRYNSADQLGPDLPSRVCPDGHAVYLPNARVCPSCGIAMEGSVT